MRLVIKLIKNATERSIFSPVETHSADAQPSVISASPLTHYGWPQPVMRDRSYEEDANGGEIKEEMSWLLLIIITTYKKIL